MDTRILSDNMLRIVSVLESLKPYESITIQADASGKLDSFIVSRSTKVVLLFGQDPRPVPSRLRATD